jgi:hypothetical protein
MSRPGPHIEPQELARLLRRVEENLATRPLLVRDAKSGLPTIHDLLQQLHTMHAPLYVANGYRAADLLKRALNLPIRLFGRKQARFNQDLLDLLGLMLIQIQALHRHTEQLQQRLDAYERAGSPRS